jgi:mRNA-degrading endonuclease RelE of RelBE toxin-antitoxin system
MLSGSEYVVKLEEPAESRLAGFESRLRARFVVVLRELELDPYLSVTGGFDWKESQAFTALRKAGYRVRRLKAQQLGDWRVFYYVDDKRRLVLVKEIVTRSDDTYDAASPHAQRLKENYRRYWSGGS